MTTDEIHMSEQAITQAGVVSSGRYKEYLLGLLGMVYKVISIGRHNPGYVGI